MSNHSKIQLIVWSKDRAVQLRLLLESIERYMPDFFDTHIVYTASSPEFREGYDRVEAKFPANYIFETKLADDTRRLINEFKGSLIAFSTDDTVIFKAPPKVDLDTLIPPGYVSFSFRYGLNTTLQDYFRNLWQNPLTNYREEGEFISWNWAMYHPLFNYGYPFGLDMHAYHADLIADLIKYDQFKSTNQLETLLFNKKQQAPQMIRSFKESVAINIPDNCMSGVTQSAGNSVEDMNKRFLAGEVISLDDIPKEFNACHYPVEYKWISV